MLSSQHLRLLLGFNLGEALLGMPELVLLALHIAPMSRQECLLGLTERPMQIGYR
jgi:hypothetical protein